MLPVTPATELAVPKWSVEAPASRRKDELQLTKQDEGWGEEAGWGQWTLTLQ